MRKDLYLFDNNKKLLKIINTESTDEVIVYDDIYTSDLSTGAETYTASFKLPYELQPLFVEGNYIGFYWQDKFKLMQIKQTESLEKIDDVTITSYAEFVGIELYNSYVSNLMLDGTVSTILTQLLLDTNYEIGYVSPALDKESFRCDVTEITSVYSVIQNLTSVFHECEWEFGVEIVNTIQGKYKFTINCYANGERGTKRYNRYEGNRNAYGMKRMGDITNFCSGIIPVGANGITITDAKWAKSMGAPLDKPLGQNYLFDPEAHALLNNGGKHILMKYKSDATDQYSLMWDAYYKLRELNQTKFSYEIPVHLTDEQYGEIDIGDTNYIINTKFNPPIQLEARIGKFEISFTDRSANKLTLANFKEVKSKIKSLNRDDIVKEAVREISNMTGKLTQADMIKIQEYLRQLEVDDETINKLMAKYQNKIVPDTVVNQNNHQIDDVAFDSENYKAIKLSSLDNGLWLGDDRMYGVVKNKCHVIENKVNSSTPTTTTATAKEYNEAVKYYSKFSLGTYSSKSAVSALQSSSNKYKIGTIVKYWAGKFGLDPQLVFAMILAESSGNPYCATKTSAGGYGLMQCERAAYFNRKQTLKFLDGTTRSFTPSYNTMNPAKGITITLNGVKVNQNISNQVMFGCHELRVSLRRFKWNIFAALMGYNFGLYGADLVICRYVAMRDGLNWVNKYGYTVQSSKVQSAYFKELEKPTASWANGRKWYVSTKKAGTATNIEYYLRWYKVVGGQLPYVIDDNKKKRGYGANKTATTTQTVSSTTTTTTIKTGVATDIRNKIVAKAKEIAALHQTHKKATYNQKNRIVDDSKRFRASGTINGIKNPYCYDCTSLVSCAYKCVGLTSVFNKSANVGTLVNSACAKSGYVLRKLTASSAEDLLPGDIIMVSNGTVPSNVTVSWAGAGNGAYRKDKGTHHAILYCGKVNGKHMMAHASGSYKWPRAIRYESFNDYGLNFLYTHGIILRPWDLAAKDKAATTTKTTTTTNKATKVVEACELNIKALPGANPGDFLNKEGNGLITDLTINGVQDNNKYPSKVSHIVCHFGINDLSTNSMDNYVDLINVLLKKYPKKPIFIIKEWYVTTAYGDNYTTVNENIKAWNKYMQDFANKTQYVIFVTNSPDVTNSATLDSTLTTNGWNLKDAASFDKYYEAYKKRVLSMCKGFTWSSSSQTVSVTLQPQRFYKYTKTMKSLTIKLPTKPDDSYYCRVQFITGKNTEPTKFVKPDSLYLQGTHCKNGVLTVKADTTYTIIIYYNPDTEIADTRYLGSVSAVSKGGKYASFSEFKYGSTLVSYAKTFYDNRSKLTYNNTTPLDFAKPLDNKDKWTTNGKYHMDDNAFLQYLLLGWNYKGSHYTPTITRNNRNKRTATPWAMDFISNEAKIGQKFVEEGWVLDGADLTNFTNVKPGDIIFCDSDSTNNGLFMGISHNYIVYNSTQAIHCTNTNNVIELVKLTDIPQERILFVGRIRLD